VSIGRRPAVFQPERQSGPGTGFGDSVPVILGTVILVIVISAVCIGFLSSGESFMAGNAPWNGLSYLTEDRGARLIDSSEELPLETRGKALLTIPLLPYTDQELASTRGFVEGGGTLIVLDDTSRGNTLLEYLGLPARFAGNALLDPIFCYRNPALPRAVAFSPDIAAAGVASVVLNHPTVLTGVDPDRVIAWSSPHSYLEDMEVPGQYPVAARYPLGQGNVALISDSSFIINSMITRDDNALFLELLLPLGAQPGDILIDDYHLTKSPMDYSKRQLARAQRAFSEPAYSLGMLAVLFAGVGAYFLKNRRKEN